jgi:hypothetical protein
MAASKKKHLLSFALKSNQYKQANKAEAAA